MPRGRLHSQPMSAAAPALEHLTGTERGRLVQLDRAQATIGRTVDNDIVLESEAVSRCHARLQLEGGMVRISDNRSKNGVLVNGERVRERILADGDIVQLGNFLFRFHGDMRSDGGFGPPYVASSHLSQPYPMPGGGMDPFDPTRTAMQIAMAERRSPYFFYGMLAAVVVCGVVLVASRLGGNGIPSVVPPSEPSVASAGRVAPEAPPVAMTAPKAAAAPTAAPVEPEVPAAMPVPVAPDPEEPEREAPTVDQVAAMDDQKAIEIYLKEGRDFLKRGDFENAAKAFQIALVIDPRNGTAMRGIRAAEFRTKDLESVPLESVPKIIRPRKDAKAEAKAREAKAEAKEAKAEADAQKKADGLLKEARVALEQKKYSDVVRLGEEAQGLGAKNNRVATEAKSLVERAKAAQREEFEPFVEQAKQLITGGRVQSGLELCEEMLRRDPGYGPARECAAQARRQLGAKSK